MDMIDNKYKKWYFSLMKKGMNREKITEISEKHHIIPKSLGGKNSKNNLVYLTLREHLLAHRLLPRFLTGISKAKMHHAYYRMIHGRQGKYVLLNPMVLLEAQKNYSEARKIMRTGTKHSEKTKQKISKSNKGKILSEETKIKISKANAGRLVGVKKPKGFGQIISQKLTGKKKTKEHSDKINKNPIKIMKTALKHRGMKRSEEAKEKMRKAALLRIEKNGGPWNKGKKLIDGKYLPKTDSNHLKEYQKPLIN